VRCFLTDERGSTPLEFITVGVLLLVPLVYLVLTLGQVQSASFAAEGAVRQAVRVFVTSADITSARTGADIAMTDALADAHFTSNDAVSTLTCAPSPSACLQPNSWVTANTTVSVALPFIPHIFNLDKYARVSVSARATEVVPR